MIEEAYLAPPLDDFYIIKLESTDTDTYMAHLHVRLNMINMFHQTAGSPFIEREAIELPACWEMLES